MLFIVIIIFYLFIVFFRKKKKKETKRDGPAISLKPLLAAGPGSPFSPRPGPTLPPGALLRTWHGMSQNQNRSVLKWVRIHVALVFLFFEGGGGRLFFFLRGGAFFGFPGFVVVWFCGVLFFFWGGEGGVFFVSPVLLAGGFLFVS